MKNNISYYQHDTNSHNHWKFKTLRRKYGWSGEGKFWALNNMIGESEYCILDLSDETKVMAVATELDFEVSELREFISFLVQKSRLVLELENGISTGIVQEIYNKVDEKREYQRSWKKRKEKSKDDVSNIENEKSNIENEQSRVDKSRVNKSKRNKREKSSGDGKAAPPPEKVSKEKLKSDFENRKKQFGISLQPYVQQYGRKLLSDFYNYWTEPNNSHTKFRREMEKTWDVSRRLSTWASRDKNFKNSTNINPPINGKSIDELREEQGKALLDAVN